MDAGTATQLITVAATLSGVVLALVVNAYLERRRAHDARELESLHLSLEHAKWLRDERLKAYLSLSIAGEEVLQFIRAELPVLLHRAWYWARIVRRCRSPKISIRSVTSVRAVITNLSA